jgi:integrase/recombinase XerD
MSSQIYFAQAIGTNLVKIGLTDRKVGDRIKDLQTANGRKLEILLAITGSKEKERELHLRYAPYKTVGGREWFELPEKMIDELREQNNANPKVSKNELPKIKDDIFSKLVLASQAWEILTSFILDCEARNLANGTIDFYKDEITRFIKFLDRRGIITIEQIDPETIRSYLIELGKTRNPGGVHCAYRSIRAFMRWFDSEFKPINWSNPIFKIKGPKVSKEPLPGVSEKTIELLLTGCSGEHEKRDRAIILILATSGLRASELLGLNWEDYRTIDKSLWVKHGKGGKSRMAYIDSSANQALLALMRMTGMPKSNDPIFFTSNGCRLTYPGLVHVIKRAAEIAHVKAPSLHDFRRFFAVTSLRQGCDIARLAGLMGHNTLDVLQRYLCLVDDDRRKAHSQFGPKFNLSGRSIK